ncbi:MAG: hypothetical protein JSR40_09355 [Proteobacteria bacterium]|nr:hypothetical protein [Pseudomonadota bacterium]
MVIRNERFEASAASFPKHCEGGTSEHEELVAALLWVEALGLASEPDDALTGRAGAGTL